MDKDFMLAVFREVNDHMRATERKYLIVTGAYIGLFTVFLTVFSRVRIPLKPPAEQDIAVVLIVTVFVLVVGLAVHMKQHWYRVWKEHYLDVCLDIRLHFVERVEEEDSKLFPFWLRQASQKEKLSIDNLLHYLTSCINLALLVVISYCIFHLIAFTFVATIIIILLFVAFLVFLYLVDRTTSKSSFLNA